MVFVLIKSDIYNEEEAERWLNRDIYGFYIQCPVIDISLEVIHPCNMLGALIGAISISISSIFPIPTQFSFYFGGERDKLNCFPSSPDG